mgnify:FL=1
MAKPTLALIPASQGSKLFSVLPSSGVGDFDFSRGSAATRINSQGLIENVVSGQSRLDYPLIDGKVVGCPHHILEPARTNLVTYSEDFSNPNWTKLGAGTGSAAIVTSDYAISPDGTQNATRLQCDLNGGLTSSANQSLIYDSYTSSGNQSISIYVKSNTGSNQTIYFANTQTSGDTITVTSDWQRFEFSHSTATYIFAIGLRGRSGGSIDDTADILIYGAQAEQASYPTSYIPTNGAAVTRSAETANGSGDATTFNDSEGVLMFESSGLTEVGTNQSIAISDGSISNRILFRYNSTNQIRVIVISGSVFVFDKLLNISSIEEYNKFVIKYKQNDFALWVNGFELGTDNSGVTPTGLSELALDDGSGINDFYGNTKQIQYYNSALTDSELEQLTSWISFTDMANGQLYTIE